MAASWAPQRTLSSMVAVPSLLTITVDLISRQEASTKATAARRRDEIFMRLAD